MALAEERVVAAPALEDVLAVGAAEQDVVLVAADEVVVARAAVDVGLEVAREEAGQLDEVVAGVAPADQEVKGRGPVRGRGDEPPHVAVDLLG